MTVQNAKYDCAKCMLHFQNKENRMSLTKQRRYGNEGFDGAFL